MEKLPASRAGSGRTPSLRARAGQEPSSRQAPATAQSARLVGPADAFDSKGLAKVAAQQVSPVRAMLPRGLNYAPSPADIIPSQAVLAHLYRALLNEEAAEPEYDLERDL